jgi:hypothetical protein
VCPRIYCQKYIACIKVLRGGGEPRIVGVQPPAERCRIAPKRTSRRVPIALRRNTGRLQSVFIVAESCLGFLRTRSIQNSRRRRQANQVISLIRRVLESAIRGQCLAKRWTGDIEPKIVLSLCNHAPIGAGVKGSIQTKITKATIVEVRFNFGSLSVRPNGSHPNGNNPEDIFIGRARSILVVWTGFEPVISVDCFHQCRTGS